MRQVLGMGLAAVFMAWANGVVAVFAFEHDSMAIAALNATCSLACARVAWRCIQRLRENKQ